MPNHVTNRLTIHAEGQRLEEILDAIKNDEIGRGSIDFNKLIPMPKSLDIESGTRTDRAIEVFLTALNPKMQQVPGVKKIRQEVLDHLSEGLNKVKPFHSFCSDLNTGEMEEATRYEPLSDTIELGRIAVRNYLHHGCLDWYDWCIRNWGTKWNAYGYNSFEPDSKSNTLSFLTAWSPVPEVLAVLSKRFPEVELSYRFADEDIGSNVGEMKFLNGEVTEEFLPHEQSREAYEMAFEIMGCSAADYDLEFNEETQQYENIDEEDMDYEMGL